MKHAIIAKKCGMTRVFDDKGNSTPVTVVSVPKHRVAKLMTEEKNGYNALQLTYDSVEKKKKINKPTLGHFQSTKCEPGKGLFEVRLEDISEYSEGAEIDLAFLTSQKFVDVSATSKGKGFAGTVKRHNFATQDATHGNSLSHRAPGSIGQNQTPGRVFKGKKMAGRMGGKQVTVQSLEIVKADLEKGYVLIKGAVPGHTGAMLMMKPAVKKAEVSDGA